MTEPEQQSQEAGASAGATETVMMSSALPAGGLLGAAPSGPSRHCIRNTKPPACANARRSVNVRSPGYDGNTSMIGLPVTGAPTNDGVRRGELERQAVYLGKWFHLMPPQDHPTGLEPRSAKTASVQLRREIEQGNCMGMHGACPCSASPNQHLGRETEAYGPLASAPPCVGCTRKG